MNKSKEIFEDFEAAVSAALDKAAELARDEAIKTNTGIVVSQNGKIVTITAEELKAERDSDAGNPA